MPAHHYPELVTPDSFPIKGAKVAACAMHNDRVVCVTTKNEVFQMGVGLTRADASNVLTPADAAQSKAVTLKVVLTDQWAFFVRTTIPVKEVGV
jgi:hypothetical protein